MLHPRAFTVTVVWTLLLLWLGSVVHATGSSLACPDWPTCYGTMVPEMTGGVFWEHLHRLVAGGLILMFGLATWLARRETRDRPWIFRACLGGVGLLFLQSLMGGLTVLYKLPPPVSTTHLALAFTFLSLATVLASATAWVRGAGPLAERPARRLRTYAAVAAGLVFAQSVLGALVRHTGAAMSCPDFPLCLGRVVPPLVNHLIVLHFFHRVLALFVTVAVLSLTAWVFRADLPRAVRRWALLATGLVIGQVVLGATAVLTVLAVAPDSLHTLFAAGLLATLVHLATVGHFAPRPAHRPAVAQAV